MAHIVIGYFVEDLAQYGYCPALCILSSREFAWGGDSYVKEYDGMHQVRNFADLLRGIPSWRMLSKEDEVHAWRV